MLNFCNFILWFSHISIGYKNFNLKNNFLSKIKKLFLFNFHDNSELNHFYYSLIHCDIWLNQCLKFVLTFVLLPIDLIMLFLIML